MFGALDIAILLAGHSRCKEDIMETDI